MTPPPRAIQAVDGVGPDSRDLRQTADVPSPGRHCHSTLSFYTVTDYHWLPFRRDLHRNLAIIAVTSCQNGGVARG
jgi:hypothetical protein